MSRRTALTLAFVGLAALVLAATALGACGDSEDPPASVDAVPGRTVTTAPAVDVGPGESSSTTTEVVVVPDEPDEPDDPIEAGGLNWRRADLTAAGYSAMRIAETDDGFLALGYKIEEGEITTWSSQDGRSWTRTATDTEALLPGEFIMEVVATPSGFIATGGEAEWWWGEGPVDRLWTSQDGATWTRRDFDLADVARPNPYVTREGTVQGIASGPGEAVLVGSSMIDLDHQAILDEIAPGTRASDELMIGIGENPPGTPSVEYLIDDGWVRMTFEEMGLPAGFLEKLGSQTAGVWRSPDGATWTPCPDATEWDIAEHALKPVAGPKGYLIDGGEMLYMSPNAEIWTEIPAETAFGIPTRIYEGHVTGWSDGWGAIVEAGMVPREGPVEGTDFMTEVRAVWTSPDGVAWGESMVPTSMLLSEHRANLEALHGGELGLFARISPETDEGDDPSRGMFETELWWSSDAVTWDPIQVGPLFGNDRIVWDLTIGTDRVVALVADWSGWQDSEEAAAPAPLELWVATPG